MFDYCLLRRDQYVEDCLELAADWVQAVASAGVECRDQRTDSNNKCWRLKSNSDAVLVKAPDGT